MKLNRREQIREEVFKALSETGTVIQLGMVEADILSAKIAKRVDKMLHEPQRDLAWVPGVRRDLTND